MTEKEEKILKVIINYVKDNNIMPPQRLVQKKLGYKSIYSVTQFYKSLESKGYLIRNSLNKLIINKLIIDNDNYQRIQVINKKNAYIDIALNKKKRYIGYIINHNYFQNKGILKGDTLIIQKEKKLKIDDYGLFLIDNKYRLMKYDYKDGFYLLTDYETIILSRVKVIGKLIQIIRII